GVGNVFNVPRPPGLAREVYVRDLLAAVDAAIVGWRPDLLLVSAGFDALAGDPLGGFTLEPADVAQWTSAFRARVTPAPVVGVRACLRVAASRYYSRDCDCRTAGIRTLARQHLSAARRRDRAGSLARPAARDRARGRGRVVGGRRQYRPPPARAAREGVRIPPPRRRGHAFAAHPRQAGRVRPLRLRSDGGRPPRPGDARPVRSPNLQPLLLPR